MLIHYLQKIVARRAMLAGGATLAAGTIASWLKSGARPAAAAEHVMDDSNVPGKFRDNQGAMTTVGDVDNDFNGFDPTAMLTDWDTGQVSTLENGQVLRTFEVDAVDRDIEIAPGVIFPAWTFNGRIPGPTLRATEGDRLRIIFRNLGSHPHSMHFHGIHGASMDGLKGSGLINPGEEFIYEFDAKPFGCHFYHCHAFPLRAHMNKGMYGAFIVDPDPALHPDFSEVAKSRLLGTPQNDEWQEFVMVMNGFDTNFDGKNEFYAVNTVAHHFMKHPIKADRARPIRVYLVNATEFDPINSFHLHGNFFDYFDHGTTLTPTLRIVDTIMQCQAQRGILEFSFQDHEPGKYMFHAHQTEFTELGWMAMFDLTEASP